MRYCSCQHQCHCRAGCLDILLALVLGPIIIFCLVVGFIEFILG